MKIKIGQLQSFIVSNEQVSVIKLRVEKTGCMKQIPGEGFSDLTNCREIEDENWYNSLTVLHLMDMFYHEKEGLFKKDADISPLSSEHLLLVNHAHDLFFDTYKERSKEMPPPIVGMDGRLMQASPNTNKDIAGLIKWMRFWMTYALKYCSKPVIANTEYIELGKATDLHYADR